MVNPFVYAPGDYSQVHQYNDTRANFMPLDGRDKLVQQSIWDANGDGANWFEKIWQDLTGQTEQAKEFAQADYFLDREQEFEREMLRAEQEYNSIGNQVKQMQAAGLNISSLFGSSTPMSSIGGTSPSAPGIPSAVGQSGAAMSTLFQALQANLNRYVANAQVDNLNTQTKDIQQNMVLRPLELHEKINVWRKQADLYGKQAGFTDEETQMLYAERMFFQDTADIKKKQLQQDYDNAVAEWNVLQEEVKNKKKQREVMSQEIAESQARVAVHQAQEDLLRNEAVESQNRQTLQSLDIDEREEAHKIFGKLPISVAGQNAIAAAYASGDEKSIQWADNYIKGIINCSEAQTDSQYRKDAQYFDYNLGKHTIYGVGDMMKSLPGTLIKAAF